MYSFNKCLHVLQGEVFPKQDTKRTDSITIRKKCFVLKVTISRTRQIKPAIEYSKYSTHQKVISLINEDSLTFNKKPTSTLTEN